MGEKKPVTGEQFLAGLERFGEKLNTIADHTNQLADALTNAQGAMEEFLEAARVFVEAHPELVEADETCPKCHQRDVGQQGEYPCEECGLPTAWGVANGLTKPQEDLVRELQERATEEKWPECCGEQMGCGPGMTYTCMGCGRQIAMGEKRVAVQDPPPTAGGEGEPE